MVALTRKRNRKTRKQQQRRRIKKHTTRRSKGRLLRTRVKKNKTRKLQRGGLNDNDTLFKSIDKIKAIPEYTAFITKYEKILKKMKVVSIKDKLDELNELKKSNKVYDKNMLNALNSAMINKIINDIFKLKQCIDTNCFDDDVLAALLLAEENLLYDPLKYPSGDIPLYPNFLRTEVELEKINAAKESFTTYYNNNNKVTNEHKINKRKKFILVLLSTATNISRNKVKLVKDVKEEKDAVPFFKTEFQDMLTHLQNDNNLFEVPLRDPTEEEIQKTGNADSFGFKTDNTAKALAGLPEEATPSEGEEEINVALFKPRDPIYDIGTNTDENDEPIYASVEAL